MENFNKKAQEEVPRASLMFGKTELPAFVAPTSQIRGNAASPPKSKERDESSWKVPSRKTGLWETQVKPEDAL